MKIQADPRLWRGHSRIACVIDRVAEARHVP